MSVTGCCTGLSNWFYNVTHTPIDRRKFLIGVGICALILVIIIILAATLSANHSQEERGGKDVIKDNPLVIGSSDLLWKLKIDNETNITGIHLQDNTEFESSFNGLLKGYVTSQVWNINTNCTASQYKDAVALTLEQIDLAKRIDMMYPQIMLSSSYKDIRKSANITTFLSVNGGHNIDGRLAVLRMYYSLGVSIMSLTENNCSTSWASAASTKDKSSLTEFGENVVKEMAAMGMIVDLTGASEVVQKKVLDMNVTAIFSHSNAAALQKHPLNIEDDVLKIVKGKNVVVMVSFSNKQLSNGTIEDVIAHLNYLKNLTGVDRVGIGANLDDQETIDKPLANATEIFPDLFEKLKNFNWTPQELKKLAYQNFFNLLKAAQEKSNSNTYVPLDERDLHNVPSNSSECYSDLGEDTVTTTL